MVKTEEMEYYDSDNSESNPPPEIYDMAEVTVHLLPNKSRMKYEKQYELFKSWCSSEKVCQTTENVLIAYMSQKCKTVKPSTLWSTYSMLKTTLRVKENLEIGQFNKLISFLKQQNIGHKSKKSKIFSYDDINIFLLKARDDLHLLRKVVLIFGIAGACRRDELAKLSINDVEDKESLLIVNISDTKTYKHRVFIIVNDKEHGIDYLGIYRKYLSLRPVNLTTDKLFIRYQKGVCTNQHVGINTIAKIPREIAEYLNLPEPALYTGHCFHRTSATLLTNTGGSMTQLKRHGGWKSVAVAESYNEDAIRNTIVKSKKKLGQSTFAVELKKYEERHSDTSSTSGAMSYDSCLLGQTKCFVNGEWVEALSTDTFPVLNPANCQQLHNVPNMAAVDCEIAIAAGSSAFKEWSSLTAKERGTKLRKWFNILGEHTQDLANIITAESGKPLRESLAEVTYGNSFVEWFSEEARRITGEVVPSPANKQLVFIKQPIGVVSLITPWNFPHAMITRKAAAALAAGCTCVIKPAEDTPLTALALARTTQLAGFPKGVFNVVTCSRENAPSVGKVMCQSPSVAGISFTGSTEVGKLLYNQCALGVKRISLELGGNAPFIVFKSADMDKTVESAVAAKFRNCGQACISPNRFLIQNEVFDTFVEKIVEKIQTDIRLGDGCDPDTTAGPLINDAQVDKVSRIVEDAIAKGARVHCGGKREPKIGSRYFQPTVLSNVTSDMACTKEEIFGPVVVCIRFTSEEEALQQANSTPRGLAGYFFSNDLSQAWRVAKKLEVGMVGINESLISSVEIAFGGIKESGLGREGSHYGIEEFTYVKSLCFGNA